MPDHSVRIAVLAVALFAWPLTARAAAASAEMDLDAFVRVLDDLGMAVASAAPEEAAAIRAQLPAVWRVRAGADVVDVSAQWLSSELHAAGRDATAWTRVRARIGARLAAMRAEAAALRDGGPPAHDARARVVLAEVLARREFQRSAASIWMERLRDRIAEWLANLLQRFGRRGPNRRAVATALAWIVALAALATLTWWLVTLIARSPGAARLGLADTRQRRRTSGAWARLALAAHAAGDAREATRCAFNAAVCRIEEEGAWKADEARTPREYLRLLPPAHRRRSLFGDITARFERIWYGAAAATADDSRRVLASLKDLGCLASDQAI